MKGFFKRLIVCLLLMVSLVFAGCENIFGKQNDIVPPEGPKEEHNNPIGGGGPKPEEPEPAPVNGYDGHTQLDKYDIEYNEDGSEKSYKSALYGARINYKKDSSEDSGDIKDVLYKAAEDILTRLVAEYGPLGVDYIDEAIRIDPLLTAKSSAYSSMLKISAENIDTYEEFLPYVKDMVSLKYADRQGTGLLLSTQENETIAMTFSGSGYDITGIVPGMILTNLQTMIPTAMVSATYSITGAGCYLLKGAGKSVYFILDLGATVNINTFVLEELADAHYDAIRHNLVTFDKTTGQLSTIPWNWTLPYDVEDSLFLTEYVGTYIDELAANIAKLQVFGTQDIGNAELQTLFDADPEGFVDFACNYIDHIGFSKLEADMIANFIYSEVIGTDVTGLESIIPATFQGTTFNSNEAITDDSNVVIGYRNFILNYDNYNTRWVNYNPAFDSINYVSSLDQLINTTGDDYIYYKNGNYDTRTIGFKNYLNTAFSACYVMQGSFSVEGILEYIDVDHNYLSEVVYNASNPDPDRETNYPPDEEDDEEETDEDEARKIIVDKYLSGKIQSIILLPKEAFVLTYISVSFELDQAINGDSKLLPVGESLTILPMIRYSDGNGHVYECFMAEALLEIVEDESEISKSAADTTEAEWDFSVIDMVDIGGQPLKMQIASLENYAGFNFNPENMRKNNPPIFNVMKKDVNSLTPPYADNYKVNNYSNQSKVSFMYNDSDMQFVEISFITIFDGKAYDYNYGFGVTITGIYGDLV